MAKPVALLGSSDAVAKIRALADRSKRINKEGLTWAEWCAAAGIESRIASFSETSEGQLAAFHAAWQAGEDPTEWRAARQGKGARK